MAPIVYTTHAKNIVSGRNFRDDVEKDNATRSSLTLGLQRDDDSLYSHLHVDIYGLSCTC